MLDFIPFKRAVAAQFEKLSKHQLFRINLNKDDLWNTYLNAFPEGSNPIYRERREYDCSCCRQFIKAVGDAGAIIDGKFVSVWDVTVIPAEAVYQTVTNALSAFVHAQKIDNLFLHIAPYAGTDKNLEQMLDKSIHTWNHFYVNIPSQFVRKGVEIGPILSETRGTHDVLLRSLKEITTEAVDSVLELVAQNSLYRGAESKGVLEAFRKLQTQFEKVPEGAQDEFAWSQISLGNTASAVSRIRNTAIGTLLIDLSDGLELDDAVNKFEKSVMAPSNYKRPTALVTKKMVEAAKVKISELGLLSALERRYATKEDISVNDILFVDSSVKGLKGDVFDELHTKKADPKKLERLESIGIDEFVNKVLKTSVQGVEVYFDGAHTGNLVSLVAPVDPTANRLFKWENGFSWSYNGDVADSIKERVKQAGGNVTGEVLCRLAWSNHDDLDLHMIEPNGHEISFRNKRTLSPNGGMLDVDMNAGGGQTRTPVENIFYTSRNKMQEGMYHLFVHQFSHREHIDVGFEVEFDYLGDTHHFAYEKAVRQGEAITVVKFNYSRAKGVEVVAGLPSRRISREVWGIQTNEFHPVNVMMLSPNYWGDHPVGNKHFFFMLNKCVNEGQARGFYNEFLADALTPHRKVIEMVGAKMRTENSDRQLSGLGFSSTQRNELLVKVKGSFTRTLKVQF